MDNKNTNYKMNLQDKIILEEYLNMDMEDDCIITKNEWMITFIKILANNIDYLQKEGPDSIMKRIKELSDEFDNYDKDGNKCLEFKDFQKAVKNSIYYYEN